MTDQRLATPLRRRAPQSRWWLVTLGGLLLAMSLTMLARRWGIVGAASWLVPAFAFSAALVLVWSPLESAVQSDARRPDVVALFSRDAWARVVLGIVLAILTLVWFSQQHFTDDPILRAVVVPVVAVVALALVLAPWWLRLIRQVGVERERRVREFERAEIAAHLHDSVLQTLTLIRAKADDPDAVARLARAQERDLRSYLYQDRRSEADSVATALQRAVSEVEDAYGVAIDVVSVGDAPTTDAMRAGVDAAKEAAQNAARHGSEPISVYAELTADRYELFVRDSGPGFDPSAVPEDRAGIRNSILGRSRRHGGDASIASTPGGRTEVTITIPRQEER
ncbi:sensor histidine kinase [Demequina zhanjiangensis]|uniref:Histidine kinase n=1 Tax=Demequina zhanjiangensis TaxID=3051659 RepID=A0ABT8FXQ9_9MICO|nr:ATP-binding protein [Demequina sp. SYSU T00b26]MDN4471588.1 histidine kinase [Demequina sp. SYSU T00b26]